MSDTLYDIQACKAHPESYIGFFFEVLSNTNATYRPMLQFCYRTNAN